MKPIVVFKTLIGYSGALLGADLDHQPEGSVARCETSACAPHVSIAILLFSISTTFFKYTDIVFFFALSRAEFVYSLLHVELLCVLYKEDF